MEVEIKSLAITGMFLVMNANLLIFLWFHAMFQQFKQYGRSLAVAQQNERPSVIMMFHIMFESAGDVGYRDLHELVYLPGPEDVGIHR